MFWRRTPRQILATFKAFEQRQIREHNERAWLAWHIEALRRSKKLPKLDKLLRKVRTPRRKQTVEEQMAIMEAWSAHMKRVEAKKKARPS